MGRFSSSSHTLELSPQPPFHLLDVLQSFWSPHMDQSGHFRSHRSPKACRNRWGHERADQKPRYPHTANEDDWETDPDYVNDGSRQREEREVYTASIISDLSRSIRDCSLRRSAPHHKKQYADHQSSYRDSCWTPVKDPEGQRTLLCPQVRSSPSLGIERSSVFNRNAAETLDAFIKEKLKAWASDATQLSDSYENEESPQEPPSHSRGQRRTEKAPKGPERTSRRQNPERPAPARGMVVQGTCSSWNNYEPGIYYGQGLRQDLLRKGEVLGGLQERQEGTAASSSARILPQCRISHVQSCEACQAFNQELPAGKEAFSEECWPPWHKEDRDRRRVRPRKGRPGSSSQRQHCKVQQWLEQSPADKHPKAEEPAGMVAASPETTCESLEYKGRGPSGRGQDAGDCWGLENPAEARHRRKVHKARNPGHQPVARIVTCDDTSPSPAACSCLFCERQRGRAKSVPAKRDGKKVVDPSAQQVAVQLQEEDRVPRIVEAFERRCRREAKMVKRDSHPSRHKDPEAKMVERDSHPSRHKDPEKRARAAKSKREGKQGHPPQSSLKTQKEEEEEPRPGVGPEGHSKHSHGKGQLVGKRPSFMDRLRQLY